MSTKKFIEDIRRIANTTDLNGKIQANSPPKDKPPILGFRGVAQQSGSDVFTQCQTVYSKSDGLYSFINIIDGLNGPRVTDYGDGGHNSCDQLNTIEGIWEPSDTTLEMIMNPDGQLSDLAQF